MFDNHTQLKTFYAFDKLFIGEISSSIWNVHSLEWLRLENNNMTGTVPNNFCDNTDIDILELDNTSWFIDSPKVDCSCSDKSCHFRDDMHNPIGTNIICPDENILELMNDHGILSTYIVDLHTNDTTDGFYFFCFHLKLTQILSPTHALPLFVNELKLPLHAPKL